MFKKRNCLEFQYQVDSLMKWGIQNMFHVSLVENTNLDKWLYVAIGRNERHLNLKFFLHPIKDNIVNHCDNIFPKVKEVKEDEN